MNILACALLLSVLSPPENFALRQRAFATPDPAPAAALLDSLAASDPDDGAVWLDLGHARFDQGHFADAANAFRHAYALGQSTRAETSWLVARAEARAARADSALTWLERAVALGFERRPDLALDSTFALLRGLSRFRKVAGLLPDRAFTRDQGWRYDLDFLVAEIRRMHYRYRREPLPPAFDAAVRALRTNIPRMSDLKVTLEMQRLLAMLGDGHSTLYVGASARVPIKVVPIALHTFEEGVYVTQARDSSLVGARVERIGGHPIAEVFERLYPYMSLDNMRGPRILGPYFATFPAALHELGLIPSADALPLSGTRRDSSPFTASLAAEVPHDHPHPPKLHAFPGAPAPRALTRVEEPFWYEDLPDSVVWMQFNQVTDGPKETLSQFAVRLRRHLDEANSRVLVVDVRNNNGGNGTLLISLLRTLVHFETSRRGARIFVITGTYTFSACQVFIAQVDRWTNAVFVGEPTGSKPTFIGEDTGLLLPWSGTRGSVSSRLHQSWYNEERVWIAPEIPVPARVSDWLAGRDAALEAILAIVER